MFNPLRQTIILNELAEWKQLYHPTDLCGKTVLDVGAGEGETAWFYLHYGAENVVCIEPDDESYVNLKRNALYHRVTPLHKVFELSDLKGDFDFMKMDIEGFEEILLEGDDLPFPALVEVHSIPERLRFQKRGWKVYYSTLTAARNIGAMCYMYWRCYP